MPGTERRPGEDGDLLGEGLELRLDVLDACRERGDLLAQGGQAGLESLGQPAAVVLDDLPGFGQHVLASLGDEETELSQETSEGVDGADAVGQPSRAQAMQRGYHLLSDVLDGHRSDLLVAEGLEQGIDVRAVGLVPDDVRSDVLGRQEDNHVTQLLDAAAPVVGRPAGLHHHCRLWQLCEEGGEAVPQQPLAQRHPSGAIGDGDLEDFLCDIDCDESIVLHGMGSFPLACQQRLWH